MDSDPLLNVSEQNNGVYSKEGQLDMSQTAEETCYMFEQEVQCLPKSYVTVKLICTIRELSGP